MFNSNFMVFLLFLELVNIKMELLYTWSCWFHVVDTFIYFTLYLFIHIFSLFFLVFLLIKNLGKVHSYRLKRILYLFLSIMMPFIYLKNFSIERFVYFNKANISFLWQWIKWLNLSVGLSGKVLHLLKYTLSPIFQVNIWGIEIIS